MVIYSINDINTNNSTNDIQVNQNEGNNMERNSNIQMTSLELNQENSSAYPPMKDFLAPNFNKNTFIFWITLIQIIMFLIELLWGQIKYNQMFDLNNTMAGPGTLTTIDLGAKENRLIQRGEIFRLFTSSLLHEGILHIFMNLIFQTMLCYTYELKWGTERIAYIYFLTAIGSSLMSSVYYDSSSVGASGALFGMIGAEISYLLMNWNVNPYGDSEVDQNRIQEDFTNITKKTSQMKMCNLVCIILFTFSFSAIPSKISGENDSIDIWTHIGGLISGVLIGIAFVARGKGPVDCFSNVRKTKKVFLFFSLIFYGLLLAKFFF